jgi:hypothetical protein
MRKETLTKLLRSRKFLAWRPRHSERIRYKVAAREEKPTSTIAERFAETHYTPTQLAKVWGVDPETIRNLFRNEIGVLKIQNNNGKRAYVTLRIPESVAVRVHRKLSA